MWPRALGLSLVVTLLGGAAILIVYARERPLTVERVHVVDLRVIPHGAGCGRNSPGPRSHVEFFNPDPPTGLPSEFSTEDCVTYRVGQTVQVMRDGVSPSHVILHAKKPLTVWALILAAVAVGSFVVFFVLGVVRAVYKELVREARSGTR